MLGQKKIFGMAAALLLANNASAEVLLLVHGYLSGADAWQYSGVSRALDGAGWIEQGVIVMTPAGAKVLEMPAPRQSDREVYRAQLPSEAPLELQATVLQKMLEVLRSRRPTEEIVVVAHSAGGVAARLALVTQPDNGVSALITIASPHLGTPRAIQALDATDIPFPLNVAADIVAPPEYRALRRSQWLLSELSAMPGSVIHWLNRQTHPEITYVSVVRGLDQVRAGDMLVPGFSQDMNNVPALDGRSRTVMVGSGHELNPVDGQVLVTTLAAL